jgi:hypothetical protein
MPRTFSLRATQLVARDLDSTFAFFADAANLQRLTPPWLDFAITSPQPITMRAGARIDYKLSLHGIPIRWQSAITIWDPPRRFVDEQIRGPYSLWRHEHRFMPMSDGTLVEDHVEYRVPGGHLVNTFVRRDLSRIFRYRQTALCDALAIPAAGRADITFA